MIKETSTLKFEDSKRYRVESREETLTEMCYVGAGVDQGFGYQQLVRKTEGENLSLLTLLDWDIVAIREDLVVTNLDSLKPRIIIPSDKKYAACSKALGIIPAEVPAR